MLTVSHCTDWRILHDYIKDANFCVPGMSQEGIFRISGNHKVVESLKATYDRGDIINCLTFFV